MTKKKTKIVIASVLKPVDDVRNYEKIGVSLAKQENTEITLLGVQGNTPASIGNITFLPWDPFLRLSFGRVIVQFSFIRRIVKLRPQLLIITTHELLLSAVLLRLLLPIKLVYDVQEDYFMNLKHQSFYPKIIRWTVGLLIRINEWITRPFVDTYFLAEKIYLNELTFTKNKSIVLDNKSLPLSNQPDNNVFKFIFTGTISEYSKTAEAIELYQKINTQFDQPYLVIIGYCPSPTYTRHLEKLAQNDSSILLKISDRPVPHSAIVNEINSAHIGIIGYQPNPINERKIPTKLYEYTAAKLPYLVRENSYWSQLGLTWGGAISVDFRHPNLENIREQFEKMDRSVIDSKRANWKLNEPALHSITDRLLVQ